MAALAALGATYTDLILNALFRGTIGTPPTTLYFSLGASGSVLTPVEITTTRTAVKVNRGWLSGQDSPTYQYQASGTVFGKNYVTCDGFDIYCTGMGTNVYTSPCILIYDAASAGNLLMVIEPSWTYIVQVMNDDILRVGRAYYDAPSSGGFSPTYTLQLPASSANYAALFELNFQNTISMGAYAGAMLTDWLWRGFDSVNDLFPVATYPNVYLNFAQSNGTVITTIPRLAVARSTGSWSAPAALSPGTNLERVITNSGNLAFDVATGTGTHVAPYLQARMSNTPQAFNDVLYSIQLSNDTLDYDPGDIISFPAGNLDFILN